MKRSTLIMVLFPLLAVFLLSSAGAFVIKQLAVTTIDIKPGSCRNPLNLRSRGVLPVAVLGSFDFDVASIDPLTVRLRPIDAEPDEEGLEPVRSAQKDVAGIDCVEKGPDGFVDLVLKFRTQDVVELLGPPDELNRGDEVFLELTAILNDGTNNRVTIGQDMVTILKKKPKKR